MKLLAAIALMAVLASPALGDPGPARPRLARSSPDEMTRFAAAAVCLPIVAQDAALEATVAGAAFPWKPVPGAWALYGTSPNYVKTDGRGGCYYRIDHGNPVELRLAVLEALKAAGAPPSDAGRFDSGPDGADSSGKYRQEGYCLSGPGTAGKPVGMVMSTRPGLGPKLQLSIFPANAGRCR